MTRNFGLSARESHEGAHIDSLSPRHALGCAHSNPVSESDRDFAALCFALFGLTAPFAIFGCLLLGWLLFFDQ